MITYLTPRKPRVSIVMPAYNREGYIQAAIDSVLAQDYRDYELIVVDDGSKDRTRDILHAQTDPRIVVVHQINQGEYPTTNNALRLARGEYLTWIHSDDVWPAGTLAARVAALDADPDVDFVHGAIQRIDGDGTVYESLEATAASAAEALQAYLRMYEEKNEHYLVHHTTILFRRRLLDTAGYWDETLPYAGDLDWMLRALREGNMQRVEGILYQYRDHAGARRVTDKEAGVDTEAVVRAIIDRYQAT
jgi:glycosyltransferase involved in cell wall biosynthesis